MRICFVLHRFPELSQTFVRNQVLWFARRGHEVDVLAARPGAHAQLAGPDETLRALSGSVTYSRMPQSMSARTLHAPWAAAAMLVRRPKALPTAVSIRRFGWFAATGTLLASAKPLLGETRRYDAIVAHFGPEGVIAEGLRSMGLLEGPLTTIFHGYDLTEAPRIAGRQMYRPLFERCERLVAISEHGAGVLASLGAPPDRVLVHHIGIDTRKFRPVASVGRDPARPLQVLSIGRLVEKKGFEYAIDAVAQSTAAGLGIEYRLIGDGPGLADLRRRIDSLGLGSVVKLLGAADEDAVIAAMQAADVLLAPSITARSGDHEGIPVVLMEALASELPVIATFHGGIPELVANGTNGVLVPERDSGSIALVLRRVAADPTLLRRMGEAGRQAVLRNFDADTQNERLERLLLGGTDTGRYAHQT